MRTAGGWVAILVVVMFVATGCAPVAKKQPGLAQLAVGNVVAVTQPSHPTITADSAEQPSHVGQAETVPDPSVIGNSHIRQHADAGDETSGSDAFEADHPRFQRIVASYQDGLRGCVAASLERGSQYLSKITSIIEEEGLPTELAYLPIVESGYRLHAVSPAGAVGPWQFMRSTGRRYGLRIDRYVDERRDPEKATRAAARYLRDLYDMFEDWHLSLAAYNGGEGSIQRVRDSLQVYDYWDMRGHLPNETREFVPRFLAAVELARAPEEHGIDIVPLSPSRYETIDVDRSISLKTVADLTGSSLSEIRDLNPALSRGVVPPEGYTVRVPTGTRESFEVAYAGLQHAAAISWEERSAIHRVRRGETLASIARRYGVSVPALMRANRMRSGRSLKVGQRLRIPAPGSEQIVATTAASESCRYN